MSDKPELTYQDAQSIVDTLSLDPSAWTSYKQRSESERLALGVVILQKILKGKSLRTIEKELGIPRATVARYRDKALESIALPTVDAARKEEIERLDILMEAVWPSAETGDDKAIANYLKISERKAKLLGLDKPLEINSTVVEITAQERELQEMLAQAERDEKMAVEKFSHESVDLS